MNFNSSSSEMISPPTRLRMASKPSNGQIGAMAERSQSNSDSRRSEQASRIMRFRLGALATGTAITLAISAAGGVRPAYHDAERAIAHGIDSVAARLSNAFSGNPDAARSEAQLNQLRQQVQAQTAQNEASKIDAANHGN